MDSLSQTGMEAKLRVVRGKQMNMKTSFSYREGRSVGRKTQALPGSAKAV